MTIVTTPLTLSVHRSDQHPIYGEGVTTISLTDEGGGLFFEVQQLQGDGKPLRLDFEEIEALYRASLQLLDAAKPYEGKE